jgi:hypothetical protein
LIKECEKSLIEGLMTPLVPQLKNECPSSVYNGSFLSPEQLRKGMWERRINFPYKSGSSGEINMFM